MQLSLASSVGLDIGSTAVRVVEVGPVDDAGYVTVRKAASVPMPDGVVVGGEVREPQLAGAVVAQAFKRAGVPRQGFVLGTSSRFTALGSLSSPQAVGAAERVDQIRNARVEFSPTVPVADAAVSWNVRVAGLPGSNEPNTLDVALLRRDEVSTLLAVCKAARVRPQAIDLTAAALLRALVRSDPSDATVSTIVDIGATKTLIATRQGQRLRSIRSVAHGGLTMTRAIMSGLDIPFHEAEDRKRFLALPAPTRLPRAQSAYADDPTPEDSTADIELLAATDQLIEEVAKSMADDAQAHGKVASQGVQLVGGGARMLGFAERLQSRLGVSVVLAVPWADVRDGKSTAFLKRGTQNDPHQLADLSAAIGLALWRRPS